MLAPALGALANLTIWLGEFDEGEHWLRRAWQVAEPHIDPAVAVLLHTVNGMLHAGRGNRLAHEEFEAAAQAQSRLSGVHAFAGGITAWRAATQARLGMPDEAHASLTGFPERERMTGLSNARAVIWLAKGDPVAALDVLREVQDVTPVNNCPPYVLVEAHLLAGTAHLRLGDRDAAAAAAEAALATAEPDRLILPFAMFDAAGLLDTVPRHETAHGALLADILDVLRGAPAPNTDRQRPSHPEALSPSELRVMRYLPTNLTRPEIAQELSVSVNTVNTHIRNIYTKLAARDRSTAVQRARDLRLLSAGRLGISPH
jgi:LuxR family transcriptional regulator, maltose regulon positive regulatory protein